MSCIEETTEFLFALRTGKLRRSKPQNGVECPRCSGIAPKTGEQCYRCHGMGSVDLDASIKAHPADVWTIRELRTLSINGSFR